MERSAVHFGKTEIAYAIERGRRQKTVAIAIDPVRGVWVRAPQNTSIRRLDQIVAQKARWILDRQRRVEDLPPAPTPREFVNGETFRYLGRQYRLKLDRAAAERSVRLIAGKLIVSAGRRSGETREMLIDWYRAHAAAHLPGRVKLWAGKIGVEPMDVLIRDQRKRWGSADSEGRIRLNWRIVQAPIRLVDYVVAHELVHLKYPDHMRAFWADLGQVMGDYEARREEIRNLGRELSW